MQTYTTNEIAKKMAVHPNTVRLYEKLGFIGVVERQANGYRIFTRLHILQFQIARTALAVEVLQNGLRKQAIAIIKEAAQGNVEKARCFTNRYIAQVEEEKQYAEEAIRIVEASLTDEQSNETTIYKRKEVSERLNISMDTLRNWEMNGLLQIKRKANGYRVYTETDIQRLKIIRSLRCANYSLSSILRMLVMLHTNPNIDIKEVISPSEESEDIVSVCDTLLFSLEKAKRNANQILIILEEMRQYIEVRKLK